MEKNAQLAKTGFRSRLRAQSTTTSDYRPTTKRTTKVE